jgi:hypothetical protein
MGGGTTGAAPSSNKISLSAARTTGNQPVVAAEPSPSINDDLPTPPGLQMPPAAAGSELPVQPPKPITSLSSIAPVTLPPTTVRQ